MKKKSEEQMIEEYLKTQNEIMRLKYEIRQSEKEISWLKKLISIFFG